MRTRHRTPVVVVATRRAEALAALQGEGHVERREAITTGGVHQALPGAHLVVADLETLTESPGVSRAHLAGVLQSCGLAVASGAAFAAEPAAWLDRARAASGLSEVLPARGVAFTALSGGVGKTTCALDLARFFRACTRLPVAVIELCPGPSALRARLGVEGWAHLYEVVTQGREWPLWEGVTLAPMEWETTRLLQAGQVEEAWRALRGRHTLTIFDAPAGHPLADLALSLADAVLVLSDQRPEALAAAAYLLRDGGKGQVVLNRAGALGRLALPREQIAMALPDVGRAAETLGGQLGKRLMPAVYPGWRK